MDSAKFIINSHHYNYHKPTQYRKISLYISQTKEIVMQLSVIQQKIYEIRGHKVMLDFDLAELYGTETRTLKQSVRRNIDRFPKDFMFQLNKKEWNELITICDNLSTNYYYHLTKKILYRKILKEISRLIF